MKTPSKPVSGQAPTLFGRRAADAVRRFPVPILGILGLTVGLSLTYLLGRPQLGSWVWVGTLVAGGAPLVLQTFRRLWRREFASDVIATLAILGAIALDQAFAGVIIVIMQSGGEAIESYAFHRASASLEELTRRAPRRAVRHGVSGLEEIDVEAVAVGDLLLVRPGDLIAVDGTVVAPEALIDESPVTGEPLPRRRAPGEPLLSGCVNVGGPFDLRADRPSRESQYARIVQLVRSAEQRKPPIERLAARYATWFTPLALIVALAGWVFTASPQTALAVLVVATPCPLIIATPIAVVGAVNRAAARGIVVKSGAAVEEIGRAKVVVLDKTGTITVGQPEVDRVVTFGGAASPEGLLDLAAAVEQFSSHPLARAIDREARRRDRPPQVAREVSEEPGSGVEGVVGSARVLVGSRSFLRRRLGPRMDEAQPQLGPDESVQRRLVAYIAVDGEIRGAVLFGDRLRPGVAEMVVRLHRLGVRKVALLTGDNRANAEAIARETGLDEFEADLLPEQKVDRVRAYREREGSTVMVGDGINDAGALAAASVGIAMGAQGAGITTEAADVVLLVDDVTRVADGVGLGQRMIVIARQGILFGLGASIVLMGIAAFGLVLPAVGAVLQELIDVSVIFNALRVRL